MKTMVKTADSWEADLKGLGFRRRGGGAEFRHNGMAVIPEQRWLTATAKAAKNEDPLWGQLGRPGLWKRVHNKSALRREFHLPAALLSIETDPDEEDQPDESTDTLEACIAAAAATAMGDLPAGWESPDRGEVEAWIPPGGLTLECGPLVRQGALVCQPDCLALRIPIVEALPEGLPEARRLWLEEVLLDAQDRWRMVRIGLEGRRQQPRVVAEVDLSGTPPVVLEALFSISLDALRWVASWLVQSAGLVADADVECRICETGA